MSDNSQTKDTSCGYDSVSQQFIDIRSDSGRNRVRTWATSLPRGSSIIDIGAGSGIPLTEVLIAAGLDAYALDASPKMVSAFQDNFPDTPIICDAVESSPFYDRSFDAALMVGVIFLLSEDTQRLVLQRIGAALNPQGRLLFSAPHQIHTWNDNLTSQTSHSLGREAYIDTLQKSGLRLTAEHTDEGGSHYYEAVKRG